MGPQFSTTLHYKFPQSLSPKTLAAPALSLSPLPRLAAAELLALNPRRGGGGGGAISPPSPSHRSRERTLRAFLSRRRIESTQGLRAPSFFFFFAAAAARFERGGLRLGF